MKTISHWIDGRVVESNSGNTSPVFDPATGEAEEVADDLALKHLRCDEDEPLAFLDPGTVEKLRHRAVSAWRAKRRLPPEAKVEHVCSCVLLSREAPSGLVGRA